MLKNTHGYVLSIRSIVDYMLRSTTLKVKFQERLKVVGGCRCFCLMQSANYRFQKYESAPSQIIQTKQSSPNFKLNSEPKTLLLLKP